MATTVTTLKLPVDLKKRVAAVLDGTDKSPHAFMLEAIERETVRAEKRNEFAAVAHAAELATLRSGKAFPIEDVRDYMAAKLAGKKPRPRKAKSWPR